MFANTMDDRGSGGCLDMHTLLISRLTVPDDKFLLFFSPLILIERKEVVKAFILHISSTLTLEVLASRGARSN